MWALGIVIIIGGVFYYINELLKPVKGNNFKMRYIVTEIKGGVNNPMPRYYKSKKRNRTCLK